MNNYEFLSLLFGFTAFVFALISIFQGKKNYKLQSEIAKLEGIYDNPQLDIQIFDKSIVKEYFLAFPLKKHGIFVVPLKISLTNKGKSRANNIEFYFNASNDILPPDIMTIKTEVNSFTKVESKKIRITENKTTYGLKMEYLDQDNIGYVTLHIPLKESTVNIKHYVEINKPENVTVNIGYYFSFSYVLKIWVHSENHSPIYKEIAISIIDTSKISVRDFFINQCIEKENQHKTRIANLSKFQRFKYYAKPNHELKPNSIQMCYITSNDFQESKTDQKVFYPNEVEIGFGVLSSDGFAFIGPLDINGYPKQFRSVKLK